MKSIVRLLIGTRMIEEREMDRVPIKGEYLWMQENMKLDLYEVNEVHWREDGHASILVRKPT